MNDREQQQVLDWIELDASGCAVAFRTTPAGRDGFVVLGPEKPNGDLRPAIASGFVDRHVEGAVSFEFDFGVVYDGLRHELILAYQAWRPRAAPTASVVRVCIESPLRGDVARNVRYANACMLDSLQRGEAPFLGHRLYPAVLDDTIPAHREMGIAAHLAWLRTSHVVALYVDHGVSSGMSAALDLAKSLGIQVVERRLGDGWEQRFAEQTRPTPEFCSPEELRALYPLLAVEQR